MVVQGVGRGDNEEPFAPEVPRDVARPFTQHTGVNRRSIAVAVVIRRRGVAEPSVQVRIAGGPSRRAFGKALAEGEFPAQGTDAEQKRRFRSRAGPEQHGNAPPPARTACLWW